MVTRDGAETPYRITLRDDDDRCEIQVEREGESWRFLVAAGPGYPHAWVEGRPRRVEWRPGSDDRGAVVLDGTPYDFSVITEARHRLKSLAQHVSHTAQEIRAPMPGLVLVVEVEEGKGMDRLGSLRSEPGPHATSLPSEPSRSLRLRGSIEGA